ncbi:MAG TPA: DNA-3-methyladenine glycosylase 2 family protein [Rhodopila sp.]|uniref:DNA-3-methyladenine glycosylase family protein n=1 Tax=Rhodopila sp. TaxID=2480087 RepID=UPI002BE5BE55|nr:DNA-3-methyladenine glycosylase 2 family protein [Rhodopila sp.]HVY14564.1 DNA-3-methyladenine glycosylase 2 family protein [Rhodopila sp.]
MPPVPPPAQPDPFPHPPASAVEAIGLLLSLDPDFERILAAAGPLPWRRRTPGFPGLLQAIVAQMISNQAAAAIWGRLRALPGALVPETLLLLPEDALRGAGLSRPKVVHARALAQAFSDGVLRTDHLATLDDEAAIAAIAAIKGMGRWSAEIYLLFALERPDIFPAGDIALAAALAHLKGLPQRPSPQALREMVAGLQPVRSLAARLLWHHWRHVTGRPALDDFRLAEPRLAEPRLAEPGVAGGGR